MRPLLPLPRSAVNVDALATLLRSEQCTLRHYKPLNRKRLSYYIDIVVHDGTGEIGVQAMDVCRVKKTQYPSAMKFEV